MKRQELEHIIRAGAAIVGDSHLVVVGSQAILGQYPDAPAELLRLNRSLIVDGDSGQILRLGVVFLSRWFKLALESPWRSAF